MTVIRLSKVCGWTGIPSRDKIGRGGESDREFFFRTRHRSHISILDGSCLVLDKVTVGSLSRAKSIVTYFDASPKPFSLYSERGFLTVTGQYQGTPVSVVCIGMGGPNVDFFIREVRECLQGDMLVIR